MTHIGHMDGQTIIYICVYNYDKYNQTVIDSDRNWIRYGKVKVIW